MNRKDRRRLHRGDIGDYIKSLEAEVRRLHNYAEHLEGRLDLAHKAIEVMKANGSQPPHIIIDDSLPPNTIQKAVTLESAQRIAEEHRQQGISDGWNAAWHTFEDYLAPLQHTAIEVNAVVANIRGAATAGRGNLPREQIRGLVEVLGQKLADMNLLEQEAREALGVKEVFDSHGILRSQEFYQAAVHFAASGDDIQLMQVIENTNPLLAEHVRMRDNIRPGAQSKTVILNEWLFCHAHELKELTGGTWDNTAALLINRLYDADFTTYTDAQRQQLLDLEARDLPGDYLRKGWGKVKMRAGTALMSPN